MTKSKEPGAFASTALFKEPAPEVDSEQAFQAEISRRINEIKQRWENEFITDQTIYLIESEVREVLAWVDSCTKERKYDVRVIPQRVDGGVALNVEVKIVEET